MIPIKVNKKTYHLPTSYDEVTTRTFIAMVHDTNDFERVATLSGIPHDTIKNINVQLADRVLSILQFTADSDYTKWHPLTTIEPFGNLPEHPAQHTWGQREEMRAMFAEPYPDDSSEAEKAYIYMHRLVRSVAIYLQPDKPDGTDYDNEKAGYIYEQLLDQPCTKVLPTGFFFQTYYLHSTITTTSLWKMRVLRAMMRFHKSRIQSHYRSLSRLQQLMYLPEETSSNTMKSLANPT